MRVVYVLYTCCYLCTSLPWLLSQRNTRIYIAEWLHERLEESIDRFFDSTNYTSMLLRSLRHFAFVSWHNFTYVYIYCWDFTRNRARIIFLAQEEEADDEGDSDRNRVAIRELSRAWCKRDEASIRRKTVTRVNGETVYLKAAWNRYDVKQKSLLLPYPAVICHEFFIVIRSR